MSYWVYLQNDEDSVEVPIHQEGGTYDLFGNNAAELNVTYNYGKWIREALDQELGLRWLDGKKAIDTIEALSNAVAHLGTDRNSDYWASTAGNAGYALSILLEWAKLHPDALFSVH